MIRISLSLAAGLLALGCSSNESNPQLISGRVEQATFPAQVDAVRVVQGGSMVAESPVASDGSFSLTIPAGVDYRIELVSIGEPSLVFPRQSGAIDTSFTIRNGTVPFDLGIVRYVGDATMRTYHQGGTPGEGDDGECEDGVDPNGAVCVDDVEQGDGACEDGTNDGETNDDGPAGGTEDGTDDGETNDDGAPSNAAIADHNLPSAVGCDQEQVD